MICLAASVSQEHHPLYHRKYFEKNKNLAEICFMWTLINLCLTDSPPAATIGIVIATIVSTTIAIVIVTEMAVTAAAVAAETVATITIATTSTITKMEVVMAAVAVAIVMILVAAAAAVAAVRIETTMIVTMMASMEAIKCSWAAKSWRHASSAI